MAVHVPDKPHAILGPSGWDRWGTCPGSVPLTEGMDRSSSGYAREGTAAHQLLEDCLTGGFDAEDLLGREYEVEGEIFTVDMDMADAVNTAIAWIRQDIGDDDVLLIEQQVPIAHLTGETDAIGSCDVLGICDGGKLLVVPDYKHGQGVRVFASEKLTDEEFERGVKPQPNGQLAMYALGALHMLSPIYDQIERVKLVVLQPRLEWHDSIELTVEELLAFGEKVTLAAGAVELERQAHLEGSSDLTLVPSEKGCKFCKAKHFCPALRNEVSTALALTSTAEDFEDLTLPKKAASVVVDDGVAVEKLAEAMRASDLIEMYIKAVRAEVERRLLAGQEVPGYYLGEGKKGNRKWADEQTAAIELTKPGRLKVDEAFDKKVISPTSAEKKLKARPKIWGKIAPLITQSDGKPSVCKVGDSNPPAKLIVSKPDDFEDLTAAPAAIEAIDPFD